jgi:hypothetical protein
MTFEEEETLPRPLLSKRGHQSSLYLELTSNESSTEIRKETKRYRSTQVDFATLPNGARSCGDWNKSTVVTTQAKESTNSISLLDPVLIAPLTTIGRLQLKQQQHQQQQHIHHVQRYQNNSLDSNRKTWRLSGRFNKVQSFSSIIICCYCNRPAIRPKTTALPTDAAAVSSAAAFSAGRAAVFGFGPEQQWRCRDGSCRAKAKAKAAKAPPQETGLPLSLSERSPRAVRVPAEEPPSLEMSWEAQYLLDDGTGEALLLLRRLQVEKLLAILQTGYHSHPPTSRDRRNLAATANNPSSSNSSSNPPPAAVAAGAASAEMCLPKACVRGPSISSLSSACCASVRPELTQAISTRTMTLQAAVALFCAYTSSANGGDGKFHWRAGGPGGDVASAHNAAALAAADAAEKQARARARLSSSSALAHTQSQHEHAALLLRARLAAQTERRSLARDSGLTLAALWTAAETQLGPWLPDSRRRRDHYHRNSSSSSCSSSSSVVPSALAQVAWTTDWLRAEAIAAVAVLADACLLAASGDPPVLEVHVGLLPSGSGSGSGTLSDGTGWGGGRGGGQPSSKKVKLQHQLAESVRGGASAADGSVGYDCSEMRTEVIPQLQLRCCDLRAGPPGSLGWPALAPWTPG